MPGDYVPKDDAGKLLKFTDHAAWLAANGAAHGFSPAEITDFGTSLGDSSTAVIDNTNKQAAAKASTQNKRTKLTDTEQRFRSNIQRLQAGTTASPADIAAAGGNVRDTTATTSDPNQVMTIPPPLLLLDFSVRRQVTVHWGTNPSNERENARPAGTIGCQVQVARGGISLNEASWVALEIDTDSPLIHVVNETVPITYAYRARYVGKNLKFGPLGDPVVCTISV